MCYLWSLVLLLLFCLFIVADMKKILHAFRLLPVLVLPSFSSGKSLTRVQKWWVNCVIKIICMYNVSPERASISGNRCRTHWYLTCVACVCARARTCDISVRALAQSCELWHACCIIALSAGEFLLLTVIPRKVKGKRRKKKLSLFLNFPSETPLHFVGGHLHLCGVMKLIVWIVSAQQRSWWKWRKGKIPVTEYGRLKIKCWRSEKRAWTSCWIAKALNSVLIFKTDSFVHPRSYNSYSNSLWSLLYREGALTAQLTGIIMCKCCVFKSFFCVGAVFKQKK